MAGRLTLWGAGELLKSYWSQSASPPQTYYLALMKDIAPSPFVSGSELDEPRGLGYTRLAIPNNTVYWSNASQPQVITMSESLLFSTATSDWGFVRYWALCNAEVEGFVYATGSLETSINVPSGEVVRIPADVLSISIGPFYAEES